jgi:hypothetical protein
MPDPATTHDLTVGDAEVVKRFRSSTRGEVDREWNTLSLLAVHAPGLAPRPILRSVEDDVVMSRIAGTALGGAAVTDEQIAAVVDAWELLHSTAHGDRLPRRMWSPVDAVASLRERAGQRPVDVGVGVRQALTAGERWIHSADADRISSEEPRQILGHGDGNLANFLWDGRECRLVDFEDAGLSDRAFEYADLVEHLSGSAVLDGEALLRRVAFDLVEARRIRRVRRLMAFYWLQMVLPGNPAARRNPPGTVDRQAARLLDLLA